MIGNLISLQRNNDIIRFKPQAAKSRDAQADAVIEYAKRVKDWPTLESAIDTKIKDQIAFLEWWDSNVAPNSRPKTISERKYFSVDAAKELTGITPVQVCRWRQRLADIDSYRDCLFGRTYRDAMAQTHPKYRGSFSTGDNEFYTEEKYLGMVRDVLENIDTDPASCAVANKTVKAEVFYDKDDDGLKHEWHGRVFLNPPYSHPLIADFVTKLREEIAAERVTSAIMLTSAFTNTAWFQEAATDANAICFVRKTIRFISPTRGRVTSVQGSAFFYWGTEITKFASVFEKIGFVALPVSRTP